MPSSFPTTLDSLRSPTDPGAGQYLHLDGSVWDTIDDSGTQIVPPDAAVVHETQHENANDAINALESKVGVDSSAVPTSLDYRTRALEVLVDLVFANAFVAGTATTDNLPEGSGNLYYTNDRADARITAQKGQASGLATLGSDSKVLSAQLPALAITSTYVVNSQAAQLALTAQEGDVAVRTDLNKSYIHNGGTAGTMADWTELLTPTDTVLSVNGYTGAVTLTTSDIAEGTRLYYTNERVDDRVAALVQNGTGIAWAYDDGAGTLTPTVSLAAFSTTNLSEGDNLYFTNERVDDRVAALLVQGAAITLTYDDVANTLTVTNAGVTSLTGTSNQVAVSSATGAVTLSLPQSIHSGASPTFAGLVFSGSSSGTTTVQASAAAGTTTLILPAATDTLIGKATTDTLTNKTLDTSGTGNVLKIAGTQVTAVTGGGKVVLSAFPIFQVAIDTQNIADFEALQGTNSAGGLIRFSGGPSGTTVRGGLGFTHSGSGADTFFAGELQNAICLLAVGALQLAAGTALAVTIDASQNTTFVGTVTATKFNGLTITSSTGTLTVAAGKTLTASNTLTFTGTDGSSVAFGTGGTVAYTANKLSVFAATSSAELAGVISDETGSGALVFAASPTLTGTPTAPTAGAGTNTTQVATTAFVSTAVAAAVAGLLEFQGSLDTSANPDYPAASKGDVYYVSVAGKVGGGSGKIVDVGDAVVASADNAGGTEASVGASWFILEHSLTGALLSANNLSDVANAATAVNNLGGATSTGSGGLVRITSPTLVTPLLGTPNSGVLTNCTGTAAGLTAGAATALATARAINGVDFDGTAPITVTAAAGTLTGATLAANVITSSLTSVGTITTGTWQGTIITSAYGGTGNGFTKFTGPTTAERTFTLPDASATILTTNTAVTVAQGGSGRASTTAYGLICGGTTSTAAEQSVAAGATTEILVGGGSSALPVWTTATGSGAPVRATSPTLVTPTLGVATATTVNKVTLTAPATGSTLTIAEGKTLTASNTLTFTGTDSSSVAFGAGGTVAYTGNTLAVFAATTSAQLAGVISDETGSGVLVFGTAPTFTTNITAPLVIGGIGTTSTLTLQATSGNGTTGADIVFLAGNNGGTETMRVLNSGIVRIPQFIECTGIYVSSSTGAQAGMNSDGQNLSLRSDGTDGRLVLTGGKCGINMTPTHAFQVSTDDAAKPTSSTWTITSDGRTKRNVVPFTPGLAELLQLRPVRYEHNGLAGTNDGEAGVGMIAQDVEAVLPDCVRVNRRPLQGEVVTEVEVAKAVALEQYWVTKQRPTGRRVPTGRKVLTDDGEVADETAEAMAEVMTGELGWRLKAGRRFDAATGKFFRRDVTPASPEIDILCLNPHAMLFAMVKGIQELAARLAALETALGNEVVKRLEALEKKVH